MNQINPEQKLLNYSEQLAAAPEVKPRRKPHGKMVNLVVAQKRFGWLTVISEPFRGSEEIRGASVVRCRCDCGKEVIKQTNSFAPSRMMSCGCMLGEFRRKKAMRHGHTNNHKISPTFSTWQSMHDRCDHKCMTSYVYYGGRGIKVCERWRVFENFLEDMGERPFGCTLDRIDVNGNYEPSNCRWATDAEQARNKRSNKFFSVNGEEMCIADWARKTGVSARKMSLLFQHNVPEVAVQKALDVFKKK